MAQQRQAHAPVGEVGKADERPAADAQQLVEHHVGPRGGLQRLAEDRVVERAVGIVGQVAVGVALDHRQAARDAALDRLGVDLHAAGVAAALGLQDRHQLALATADVEHA